MKRVYSRFRRTGVNRVAPASLALLLMLGAVSGPATTERASLPRLWQATDVSSPGRVIRIGAGDNLQAALERAVPGDTIELEAGASFRGPFILPRKPERHDSKPRWITVRASSASAGLPPAGVRVSPANAAAMARLEANSGAVMSTAPGAHHYRFVGIEFSPSKGSSNSGVFLNALIQLGENGASTDDIAHHIVIERCYLHGDPRVGSRRGIVMNSAATEVVDSYLADFKMRGEDSQAIIGWAGPGPYRIHNNYLEAAGENLMFGGGDPEIPGRVPADIEISGNHFAKPLAWRAGSSGYKGTSWTVKNLLELKNARRVLISGNLFEYNWPESQNGFAILFTVRNQDGSAPWSVVEDVTFSNNIVRHVASGINILGHDDNYPSQQTRRIVIRNNLFDDVGGIWGRGDLFQLLDGTESVTIEHNNAFHAGNTVIGEGRLHRGFVFRNNIVRHNRYGIVGTGSAPGIPALERYFAGAVFLDNLIVGGSRKSYPAGNAFPSSIQSIGFLDPANGDFRLKTTAGRNAGVNFSELCGALSLSERPRYCVVGAGVQR